MFEGAGLANVRFGFGPNIISAADRNFGTNPGSWVLGSGAWTIGGGVLTAASAAANTSYPSAVVANAEYWSLINVGAITNGTVKVGVGGIYGTILDTTFSGWNETIHSGNSGTTDLTASRRRNLLGND